MAIMERSRTVESVVPYDSRLAKQEQRLCQVPLQTVLVPVTTQIMLAHPQNNGKLFWNISRL